MHADKPHGPDQPLVRACHGPGESRLVVRPHGEAGAWTPAAYGDLCYRFGRLEALLGVLAADVRALRERVAR